jgi:isopenicillin-N N-acyltransferase-like protein
MRQGPRTCEYYYVIADGNAHTAVGIKATPDTFEVVHTGEGHPQLDTPIKDTVLLSAGDRYRELTRRVKDGFGKFDADSARELMTRPVCMNSNIHSVLFAPDTLDFWVANSDGDKPASHTRYTKYNLAELIKSQPAPPAPSEN